MAANPYTHRQRKFHDNYVLKLHTTFLLTIYVLAINLTSSLPLLLRMAYIAAERVLVIT